MQRQTDKIRGIAVQMNMARMKRLKVKNREDCRMETSMARSEKTEETMVDVLIH